MDYRGVRGTASRQKALFGYVVPISLSKFQTRTDSGTDVMGYHGEFEVDVSTGQLETLQISTDEMPKSAMVCGFDLNLRYDSGSAAGPEIQLPSSVVMEVEDVNHTHTKTMTLYGQCHEFLGESVLRFSPVPANEPLLHPQATERLRAGIAIQIKIITAIDPRTAWAGDPIQGKLMSSISDERGNMLIPAGTLVSGRLVRMETWERPSHFYTVALQFRSLRFASEEYELRLKSLAPPATDWDSSPLRRRIYLNNPPISDDPAACRFRLSGREASLKNLTTYWVTE